MKNKLKKTTKLRRQIRNSAPIIKLRPDIKVTPWRPSDEIADVRKVAVGLAHAIKDKDAEAFTEILDAHIVALTPTAVRRRKKLRK